MPRQPFGQPLGSLVVIDLTHDQRVVTCDCLVRQADVGLRRSRLLALERNADQKSIQGLMAAVEPIDRMGAAKLFDSERDHLFAARFKHAGLIEELGEARGWSGRSVQGGLKGLPLLSVQPKTLAIG